MQNTFLRGLIIFVFAAIVGALVVNGFYASNDIMTEKTLVGAVAGFVVGAIMFVNDLVSA